jgi:flagellar hook-associated protein 3 FlgL
MRVTNQLLANTLTSNLSKISEQMLKTQEQVSSGKRINRPSDDPIGMGKVLDYRTTLSQIDQYNKNIVNGQGLLQQTDSTLSDIENLITQAKELAVSQATGTASAQTRTDTAEAVKNIYDQIVQLANTQYDGSYIFAGNKTDTQPFSRDDDYNVTYSGDSGKIQMIIGENASIDVSTNGEEVLTGGTNVFNSLRDLITGLENNDTTQISNQIDPLGQALNQVVDARSSVGAKLDRLQTTQTHWESFKTNVTKILSGTEDADITTTMTDFSTQQTCYQAALAVSAKVIQKTLLDFLS